MRLIDVERLAIFLSFLYSEFYQVKTLKEFKMSIQSKIYDMTRTQDERNKLENLSNEDKLKIILELSESDNFIDLLYFIESAYNDSEWCRSYR